MNNIYITPKRSFGVFGSQKHDVDGFPHSLIAEWRIAYGDKKDFSVDINGSRYRVNVFETNEGTNASLRELPNEVKSCEELQIDKKDISSIIAKNGLTIFCGQTGAGKSTTMNSVINYLLTINNLGPTVTIEDPIEYLHSDDMIFQREVGENTASFESGLIEAMRQFPKTIVIGEIRDAETAFQAVKAGLNGHRVLATFHASSIQDAIIRMASLLSDQSEKILAQALSGIMVQELAISGSGDVHLFYEVLKVNDKVRNILNQILDKNDPTQISVINHQLFDQDQKTIVEKKSML